MSHLAGGPLDTIDPFIVFRCDLLVRGLPPTTCAHYWNEIILASPAYLSPRHAVIKQIINVIAIGAKESASESQSPAGAYRYAMVAGR